MGKRPHSAVQSDSIADANQHVSNRSVIIVSGSSRLDYQLAFFTPGIRPSRAKLRKQIRQIWNLRYTARDDHTAGNDAPGGC